MTAPERRPRVRKRGHRLILASNLALALGAVVVIVGLLAGTTPVIVVGVVLIVVSIAVSMTNARARKRRTAS